VALIEEHDRCQGLEQALARQRLQVVQALEGRAREALRLPAEGPAADHPVTLALAELVEQGDVGQLALALGRLVRAADFVQARADLLGLAQTPRGIDLVRPSSSHRWVRHRGDGPLVERLRTLAWAPCDVLELLSVPGQLEEAEAALAEARRAGSGRPRRWWAALYRDMGEWLRGRIASLPRCGPPWQAPDVETLPELGSALDWLARVEEGLRDGLGLPREMREALVESELVGPGRAGNGRAPA
jgi:hypothetical protein